MEFDMYLKINWIDPKWKSALSAIDKVFAFSRELTIRRPQR